MRRFALLAVLAGCLAEGASDVDDLTSADAPVLGDGSNDTADRNCHVVLRQLTRNQTGLQFETVGVNWVWQGTLEISNQAAAEGFVPRLMYRKGTGIWRQVTATVADQAFATPGFKRYSARISTGLVGPGTSGTTLANTKIEVIPFLRTTQGGRIFDHNRMAGDLDNYRMTTPDFAIWSDPAVCQPPSGPQRARLVFDANFTQHREGVLSPGGEVSIVYAQSRLDQCKTTQNGYQLWDLTAHVRFEPGMQLRSASVRDAAATMSVPTDARRAVVWFESTSVHGCHQWDSNYGANYTFDAATPLQWVGNAMTLLTRDTSGDHCGGGGAQQGFQFDTWVRQRAAWTNLCFQVYQPGMTDHDDAELWQKLDVSIRWRGSNLQPWTITPVNFDTRVGNDARYAFNWRAIDPFRPYHCPEMPTTVTADQMYRQAIVEYYIVVNGYEVRPAPGAAFSGTFTDYKDDAWRAANCQL